MNQLFWIISFSLLLSSCYRVAPVQPGEEDVFHMDLSPEFLDFMQASTDTSYNLEPSMAFAYNDHKLIYERIWVRGETALDYRRKSFGVRLSRPIILWDAERKVVKELTRFKLISMAMDYTYINNRLAFGMMEEAGIMPLFHKYVELSINGEHQGVYFLVEDPEQYSSELFSECIIRRGYHNGARDLEYDPVFGHFTQDDYLGRFKEIYSLLNQKQGEELYLALKERLDLDQYYRKIVIDYLLKNGDTTDELYLYAETGSDQIQYRIIPWDCDDLFASKPHEVGRAWAVGQVFGTREYPDHQAVLDVLGDRLVFSIEDDLDYIIATDLYIYEQYEEVIDEMLHLFSGTFIPDLFGQIEAELEPFLLQEEVIGQTQYDRDPFTYDDWKVNMLEKEDFLLQRLEGIKLQRKLSGQ